jgi:lambda repressor-like predicted transcriptional regulator
MIDENEKPNIVNDPLIARERIRGADRVIPAFVHESQVTQEHIDTVIVDALSLVQLSKMTIAELAKSIGYDASTLSSFLNGSYPKNRGPIAIELDRWLSEEHARRSKPTTAQFCWSNVAMLIKSTASYALDHRSIGVVYSPDSAGFGKTTSLRAIAQEFGPRRCSLITIDKVDASPSGLIRKLCTALKIGNTPGRGSIRALFERIVEKIRGRNHLLLVDQTHNLLLSAKNDRCLYMLCDLQDATAETAGQLWASTTDIVSYLDRQQSKRAFESLAQIRRRLFPVVDLLADTRDGNGGEPLFTVDQIIEIFAKNKMRLVGGAPRFLCKIANTPDGGGIGLCVRMVEYATWLCEQRRLPGIDESLLREALRRGLTSARADLLAIRMPDAPARMAQVG